MESGRQGLTIRFDQVIREVPAINKELALQYGPLLYVLAVQGTPKTIKTYPKPGFEDYLMSADNGEDKKALPASQRASKAFGFTPRLVTVPGASLDRPLDRPPVVLEGKLVSEFDGAPVTVQLVPMGAQSARLRQVTFPVVNVAQRTRPFGRFMNPGSAAAITAPADIHPMFSHRLLGQKRPIACRFAAQPNTPYRVFIGLNEAWWAKPGQRMMDIEQALASYPDPQGGGYSPVGADPAGRPGTEEEGREDPVPRLLELARGLVGDAGQASWSGAFRERAAQYFAALTDRRYSNGRNLRRAGAAR